MIKNTIASRQAENKLLSHCTENKYIQKRNNDVIGTDYVIQSWESFVARSDIFKFSPFLRVGIDHESLCRNLEDYIIFYQGIMTSLKTDTPVDGIYRAVIILIKAQTGKSLHYNVQNHAIPMLTKSIITIDGYVSDFMTSVKEYFHTSVKHSENIQSYDTSRIVENGVEHSRNIIDTFESFKETIMFKKLYKLCMYLLANRIFDQAGLSLDKMGYSALEVSALENKFHMGPDFLFCLFDTCTFILQKGFQVYKTRDVECIFHSGDTYKQLYDNYNTLRIQSTQLHNPDLFGFKISSFRRTLDHTIEQAENISKHTYRMSYYDKNKIRSVVNDLWLIKTGLVTKRAARQTRKCPFSLLVYGETGIGKSYIKDMLFNHYGKEKGLEVSKDFIHTRNPASEFWDGFQTYQWCLVMDDIAFMHPNKCASGDKTILEFIQVINNLPFSPNQADLADKGKTPFQGEFVIGTTNTEDLNASFYFSHPSAVQRRFPYIIEPKLKPYFRDSNGMLDGSKLDFRPGEYTDAWTYDIKMVIPVSVKGTAKKPRIDLIKESLNLKDFLQWMSQAIEDFDQKQNKMMQSVDTMMEISNCTLCRTPTYLCDCADLKLQYYDEFRTAVGMGIVSTTITVIGIVFFTILFYSFVLNNIYAIPNIIKHRFMCWRRRMLDRWFPHRFDYWNDLGEQVRQNIGAPVIFASFLALSVSLYSILRLRWRPTIQTFESKEKGSPPQKQSREKDKNPWYRDEYILSHFDMTPASNSQNGRTFDDFAKIVSAQCVSITTTLQTGDGRRHGKAFCLKGNVYVTNNHNIPPLCDSSIIVITTQTSREGVNENFQCKLTEAQVIRYPERDKCVLLLRNIPPKKGLYNYIVGDDVSGRYPGLFVKRQSDGSTYTQRIPILSKAKNARIERLDLIGDVWRGDVIQPTIEGDCGSLYLIDSPVGKAVVGLHIAGNCGSVVALTLTKSETDDYLAHFPHYACGSNVPTLKTPGYETPLTELHPKSTLRYIESGTACVYGSFVGFRPNPSSRVNNTPMNEHLKVHGYQTRFGRPDMKSWRPWRLALLDLTNPVSNIDMARLESARKHFEDEIISRLKFQDYDMLGVLDDFTTINGAAGIAYLDKVPRKTSAGFPFRKSKHYFLEPDKPRGGIQDPVKFSPLIMERVNTICSHYINGNRASPVFTAHLKDEPVEFSKVESGKTRVFAGAPVDFTLVVRKYLLNFVRLVQNNKYIFESAPGLIAQSIEWHKLGEYLTKFGSSRMVAGDYRRFDKTMSPLFSMAAFDIIISLCERSGNYTPEDLLILQGIATDTCYPLIDFNGDLVQLYGSNPSGHPLTVILNGLVNSLYMRYAYYELAPSGSLGFKENVALMTYGDDNVAGVSINAPWYNHTSISNVLQNIGVDYTMADKNAKSVPYIPMCKVSFLKRTWRWDNDLNHHLAPLDHLSIEKMLMVWVQSKSVPWQEQAVSTLTSATREYFFYGKTVFEKRRLILSEVASLLELDDWIVNSTFPTWETLVSEYTHNSLYVGHT